MLRAILALSAILLLSACTSFNPGLIDAAAESEAADSHLVGNWQTGEGKKATYLNVVMETPTLLRVKVADKGRCQQIESFAVRMVTVAGQRYLDVRRHNDKAGMLGSYQWKRKPGDETDNDFDVWGTNDELFTHAVDQGQLLCKVQRTDKAVKAEVTASPVVLRDFLMKHPDAMKPIASLHRIADFPC